MKLIHIINGPNLASLGKREPEIYGTRSFDAYLEDLRDLYPDATISYYQSNHEGELIDALYRAEQSGAVGVVLNAGCHPSHQHPCSGGTYQLHLCTRGIPPAVDDRAGLSGSHIRFRSGELPVGSRFSGQRIKLRHTK